MSNIFTGIVEDTQKAQKSSIDPNNRKSIQFNSTDKNSKFICYGQCY